MRRLIVFDFDGVIADSETLACTVLADAITERGVPTTPEAAMRAFIGKRSDEVTAGIEAMTGRPVGAAEAAELERRTLARFRAELREIAGIRDYLAAFAEIERCIASSSSPQRLAACLEVLGLADAFGARVYSAEMVERGKPHPDLFLHAARESGVAPADAIVIEDGIAGVHAAVAAGMTVIGFVGGSHVGPDHAARLRAAGAYDVGRTWRDVGDITRRLLD